MKTNNTNPNLDKYVEELNDRYDGKFYIELLEAEEGLLGRIDLRMRVMKLVGVKSDLDELVAKANQLQKKLGGE